MALLPNQSPEPSAGSNASGEQNVEASPLWGSIRQVLGDLTVKPAGLTGRVMAEVAGQSPVGRSRSRRARSVAASHRMAATVASLTALLVLSISTSGLLDKPSQQIAVAGSDLYHRVMGIQPQDWDVVVVAVPASQHATMRQKMRASVMESGMTVASIGKHATPAAINQPDLFISGADSSQDVLGLLLAEMGDVDVTTVMNNELDRSELLAKFARSMESPTRSERYFGEMLVVHRGADGLAVSATPLPLRRDARSESAVVRSDVPAHHKSALERSGGLRRPTLVVLTTRKAELPGPQGARSPQSAVPDMI